ncbi:response regulator [Pseudoalteromonas tetraodonis]|uniref:response regulator n=1 Tax=Pseudoalteromonas tetraodonis TaxID=43659 RepID=UPI003D05E4DA
MQRVLIVEDNIRVQQVLKHIAAQYLDVLVDFASSLTQCKQLLSQTSYSLALVDLPLSGQTDMDVARYILSQGIPTLLMTTQLEESTRLKILELGIIDYIIKDNRDSYLYAIKLVAQLLRNQGRKALVVDNSLLSSSLVKQMLEKQLFDVITADNSAQALHILNHNRAIKLVITNHNLTDMNGFELIRAIRNVKSREQLAIIGLADVYSYGVATQFIKSGANDFLTKPFTHEEFHFRVVKTMESLWLGEAVRADLSLDATE